MRWVRTGADRFDLVVVPLHGRGNQDGEGAGVRVLAYTMTPDPGQPWETTLIDDRMHMTHNFDVVETQDGADVYLAGREGVRRTSSRDGAWRSTQAEPLAGLSYGAGEVRTGSPGLVPFITTIEPMHGTHLIAYVGDSAPRRMVLDSTMAGGHALATGDLLGIGRDQIVAGWRQPNDEGKVGIRLYVPDDETGSTWTRYTVDDNTMATEDLKLADLDADGRLDIIAAGRATNNLVIYWNRTP